MPSDGDSQENVRVVVRVRPLDDKERKSQYEVICNVDDINCTIKVHKPSAPKGEPPKEFTFDSVFGCDSKQVDVYNLAARPIVDNILEGYNGTIFAYGQTGTGKTFTMEGNRSVPELKGIIPNSFAHIFGHIAKAEDDKKFLVRVSYLEIYNEDVRDLLRQDQSVRLEVKERPGVGVYVKDLLTHVVHNADEMDKIMTFGNKNRSVGATKMNSHSSRSHAIFTITVECAERGKDGTQHWRVGKLHLVDLAGSERQSKTEATGQRLKEATKINLSLSTLGNVISALVDSRSTHIPYRNSKLTRLLQDSLGGNSKTLMCANIGPANYNYDETISTLRYANRAKNICNRAKINEDPKDALLKRLQEEIKTLKDQIDKEVDPEESGSEEDGSSGEDEEKDKTKKKKKKKLKEEEVMAIKKKIEEEKLMLEERKDMEEEERNKLQHDLEKHEKELKKAHKEQEALKQKLAGLERKILVGGENLLEKAEEQERLLDESSKELEERRKHEQQLRDAINQKEAERIDMEERYSSLQEEAAGKSRKLKKVWTLLMAAKSELTDLTAEHQREMEALLESVRHLSKEHKLHQLIIDSYIPNEYQEMIERYVHWNDDIGEWQLKCVAYTGNNMRKQLDSDSTEKDAQNNDGEMWNVYLTYSPEVYSKPPPPPEPKPVPKAPKPRKKSGIPRPKHSKSQRKYAK